MKHNILLFLFALMVTSLAYGQPQPSLLKEDVLLKSEQLNSFVDLNLKDKDLLKKELDYQKGNTTFHLFSHGQPGQLLINNQWLSHSALAAFIQPLLQDKNHLNIYGCHFAQGEKGRAALAYLETALGISVAASDDLTGVDGDWDLEVGNFKNGVTIQEYSHNLQQGTLPIQPGMAVTTCGSFTEANQFNSDPNGYVFGIFDIREPGCSGTPGSNAPNAPSNWANAGGSNAYHDSRWTNTNLGEVFGVDLEYDQANSPDIFLSSCGLSVWHNSDQYPRSGGTGGEVFRIDGTTGDITVLATLPSTVYTSATGRDKFTGLGNLSYNADQQKVYVTNLDNGYIHVVDATTANVINQTYDPTPSIPEASIEAYEYTTRPRMVYGIEYNKCDNRLYFARPNTQTTVDIFSVGLNTDGTIDASTNHTLEATIAVETDVVISDIEFSDDCTQMLTSERKLIVQTISNVFLLQTEPHFSEVKRHDLSGGTWSLAAASYSIGDCTVCSTSDTNAGGGVSFGYGNYGACGTDNACADAMVATADALVFSSSINIYGLQVSDIAGTSNYPADSYFVDLDGNTGSAENADKSTNYDVDVFGVSECSMVSCSIDTDGLASVSCTGTNAITFSLTPTGTSVGGTYNVSVSGGGATSISPTSGTYGAATTFTLNDNSAGGGDVTITLTDGTESSCTRDVTVTDPGACLASCSIDTDGLASVSCTGTNAITFSLTPTGTSVGGTYNVSVSGGGATSISPTSGTYGAATTFTLNDNSAGGGDVTITLTDGTESSCTRDVTIADPGTCLASCSLSMSQTSTCSESGGVYTQTYDLTFNWTGPPSTGGLSITLTGDGTLNTSSVSAATLAGGSTTTLAGAFTVPADGNGTTTITATFDEENACTSTFTLKAPVPCPADVSPCASTAGCIGGKVFEDFNCNGADDADAGVQGVQIQVYDCDNNLVGTGYSDSDGEWQVCGLSDGDTYRIESVLLESVSCWASPSHVGTDNGSSVQFAQPGSCTDFALVNPLTACFNPTADKLMTTCFTIGDPLAGGVTASDPTIINFNYAAATLGDAKTASATAEQTGSVWGLAYTKQTDVLYMAAMLKRHSGLGPDGLGAIYSSSPYSSPPSLFYDLSAHVSVGTIPDNPSRGLGSGNNDVSHDVDAFNKVGKVGIGDIDITPDGSTLYVVNLFDKLVYAIDIANPSAAPLALPALPDPGCTNGEARPWGLEYHNGALYASLTCTAENGGTRDDLEANVYKYNGTSWSASILQIPLNYSRGCSDWASSNSPTQCNWNPWVDDWVDFGGEYSQPSPILSDIEFDDEGNMILGFIDRTGHQLGHWNYSTDVNSTTTYRTNQGGDILKAHNNSGTYLLENNGTVGGQTASGSNTNGNPWNGTGGPNSLQGPGGGEFFWADYLTLAGNAPAGSNEEGQHSELASGGLAISAADNIVLSGAMDPNGYDEGGVIWLDNTNGSRAYSLTLYAGDNNDNLFGKATGIGDVEAITSCAPLPLEIGNYVWCDTNGNGIQDACESGISDIIVQLYDITGTLVGQDTTVNGQYYFNQNNVDIMGITVDGSGIASPTTAWSGMSYSTQYFIVFGAGGQFATNQFTVGGEMYGITAMANAGSNDNIDSDVDGSSLTAGSLGARPDGLPYIDMTTSATGCGDHKYDLGVTCTSPTYSLGNQVFTDTDNSGDLNGAETGIDGVNLQLLNSDGSVYDSDPNTAGDQALTVTTANGGYYRFDALLAGDYIVEVLASNFTATNTLENFVSSTGTNQEADPNSDGDLNDNGLNTPVSGATRSGIVTLGTPEPTIEVEPSNYSAGSSTGMAAADLFSNLTLDFGFYELCELTITENAQSTCNDNGTSSDSSDDYFTIDFNATAVNASAQYEVVLGANADGTGGTVLATSNYGTAVTVGTSTTFAADGTSTYAITVRDATTNTCHQDLTTTSVTSCSNTCELTITENAQSTCNDNGTSSDSSDDYFTIDFNATAVNAGAQYEVVLGANADGTGGTVLATSNYGTAVTVGTSTTFAADGTSTYAITVRDATTNTCHQDVTTTSVTSCSNTCELTITENAQSTCNDNGTSSDSSDDYFTIDFNATGVNAGAQYEVVLGANADGTGGTVLATSNYGTAVTVGTSTTFAADGTSTYAITVRDATTNTCHQDLTTTSVTSCSNTCELTITENAQSTCNDNGTSSDSSDDYFTIDFNATAINAGAQYEVVLGANADGTGGTVLATSNYGTAVTVGTSTTFAADGTSTYAITVRDATTNTCHQDLTTTSVTSCSNTCELTITENAQSTCNDNGTSSDSSDDYFTIDFNATAINAGAQYEVVLGANADGTGGTVLATSNYGTAVTVGTATTFAADGTSTYAITVRDATTNTCHQDVTTTAVASCFTCPTPSCIPMQITISNGLN